jgi:hypothetical protein
LGLGRHLVHELGLKDRGDTLGLWMAHHIAALIKEVEKERSPTKRKRAQRQATETILQIWEHRESLPSYAYPLARYDNLFRVLDRLQPSDNPFRYGQDLGTKTDQLAEILFDSLSRLIICLLLMKPLSLYSAETVSEAAVEALSEEEKQVWSALQKWNELFLPKSNSNPKSEDRESKTSRRKIDLKKIALKLVEGIKSSVEELQTELQKPVARSNSSSPHSKSEAKKARKRWVKRK